MEDRRKQRRQHLMLHMRVFNVDDGTCLGHLADITPEGMMLSGEDSLEKGRVYRLEMRLPVDVGGVERITFTGRVIWSKNEIGGPYWDTGLEVLDLDERQRNALQQLIEEFTLQE